ncbi:hypothetical protein [Streptomyces sp. NPDC126499]|uniref:hypothetical protein n=1 Tax=Streptomyces sp. NPDC126499 TaxID=3155314 RepID=UPI00331B15D7
MTRTVTGRGAPAAAAVAALALAVTLTLGATGCAAGGTGAGTGAGSGSGAGTGAGSGSGAGAGTGGGAPSASTAPQRPVDAGPFSRERVRGELAAAMADAGAPSTDPSWETLVKRLPADSWARCLVVHKAHGTRTAPLGLRRYEAVLGELGERGWRERPGLRKETKGEGGAAGEVQRVFTQRGWSLVAEFRGLPATGQIGLQASEDACVARAGGEPGQAFPYAKLLP